MGAVEGEIILIRMRLSGGQQVAAESKTAATGIAEVGAAADASAAQATKATSGIRGAMSRMVSSSTMLRSVGRTWTTHFTLPIVAGVGLAVKSALDFRSSMEQIHTQAGASAAEVHNLSGQVLDFASSGQSTHGPQDLANALFHIESAGFRGARAMDVLRRSEALATTGHADMESTTNALVGALNSGIKGTHNLGGTIGTLNAIVGAGNMRMNDLTSAMGTGLLKRAQTLGITLPQVGAALATMTRQGQPATASATRFTMAMNLMQSPTSKAIGALKAIGINADQLGILMQKHDLPGAFDLLRKHLDALGGSAKGRTLQSQAVSAIFGGGRTSGGIQSIITSLDTYKGALAQVEAQGTPKTFEELHKAAQADPAARLAAAWTRFRSAMVKLGDALIPVVIPALIGLATVLSALVSGFTKLPGPVQIFIGGMIVLGAVFGPVVWGLGAMAGAVDALAVAFGVEEGVAASAFIVTFGWIALLAGAALGFVILYEKVKWFRDGVNAVIGFILAHWRLMVAIMFPIFGPMLVFIIDHFKEIEAVATWVFHAVVNVVRFAARAISFAARLWFGVLTLPFRLAINFISAHFGGSIKNIVSSVFNWLVGAAHTVGHAVSSVFSAIGGAISGAFNSAIQGVISAINWLIGAFNSVFDRTIDTGVPGIPVFHGLHLNPIGGQALEAHNPHNKRAQAGRQHGAAFAMGGLNPTTGWRRVGEHGPELVRLPAMARVFPYEQSRSMATEASAPNLKAALKSSGSSDDRRPIYLVPTRSGRRVIAELVRKEEDDAKARA